MSNLQQQSNLMRSTGTLERLSRITHNSSGSRIRGDWRANLPSDILAERITATFQQVYHGNVRKSLFPLNASLNDRKANSVPRKILKLPAGDGQAEEGRGKARYALTRPGEDAPAEQQTMKPSQSAAYLVKDPHSDRDTVFLMKQRRVRPERQETGEDVPERGGLDDGEVGVAIARKCTCGKCRWPVASDGISVGLGGRSCYKRDFDEKNPVKTTPIIRMENYEYPDNRGHLKVPSMHQVRCTSRNAVSVD
jgi:hypothetical protein